MSTTDTLREAAKLVCFNCRNGRPTGCHLCAAMPIWDRIAQLESDADCGKPDPDDLSHEMAEEYSKSAIEGATITVTGPDGHEWYDLGTRMTAPARQFIEECVAYLDAAGVLKRCPQNPRLVGWDEDGLEPRT